MTRILDGIDQYDSSWLWFIRCFRDNGEVRIKYPHASKKPFSFQHHAQKRKLFIHDLQVLHPLSASGSHYLHFSLVHEQRNFPRKI